MLFYESVSNKIREWTSADVIIDSLNGVIVVFIALLQVFSCVSNWTSYFKSTPVKGLECDFMFIIEETKNIDKIQEQLERMMVNL